MDVRRWVLPAVAVLLLSSSTIAQVSFQRTYGGRYQDVGFSVARTAGNGYVMTGYIESIHGNRDLWVIRADSLGNSLWSVAYDGSFEDAGQCVRSTRDRGYIVAGWTSTVESARAILIKIDEGGDTAWTRVWDSPEHEFFWSVDQTNDGGYIAAGHTKHQSMGSFDAWLVKTDAQGDEVWTRRYGGADTDQAHSVVQTSEGGYILVGTTKSGILHSDLYLVKTDGNGNVIWENQYGGSDREEGYSVQQTSDGGYIAAGHTTSYGSGDWDYYLVKTNANGAVMWEKAYGSPRYEVGYSAHEMPGGGYAIAGYGHDYYDDDGQAWLVRTDADGDTLWSRTLGGESAEACYSALVTPDGGYALTGYTCSDGAGESDVWLIKTDSLGNVAVEEPKPPALQERAQNATVISRAQLLARMRQPALLLFDAAGRQIADPTIAGAGIYFIRDHTVSKVLVTQ